MGIISEMRSKSTEGRNGEARVMIFKDKDSQLIALASTDAQYHVVQDSRNHNRDRLVHAEIA